MVESITEFVITVKMMDDGSAQMDVRTTTGAPYVDIMCAAEFMLWTAANRHELDFEDALQALCKRARDYRLTGPTLVPRKGAVDHDKKRE